MGERPQLKFRCSPNWPDAKVEQLKALWTEGLSCSQIARVFADGTSRNAIIGKVSRLGLSDRALRPRRPAGNGLPRQSYTRRQPTPKPAVLLPPTLDANGNHFTVLSIAYSGQCKWPYDAPEQDGGYIFCAHPTSGVGHSWCEAHHAAAYNLTATARANESARSRDIQRRAAARKAA